MSVIATENVSVNVSIPSLAAGASTTVSQRQGLQAIPAVNPSTTDIGQAIFSNVSVAPPDNIMPGHPTIQVITQQGAPAAGLLQPGLPYTNLALNVDLTVFAMTVFAGGSATVSATVLLLGTASGNQA
jgi:predicted component of type VI protein secretion system